MSIGKMRRLNRFWPVEDVNRRRARKRENDAYASDGKRRQVIISLIILPLDLLEPRDFQVSEASALEGPAKMKGSLLVGSQ